MLQIHDIRQSHIYQEAMEEGREEGRKEGEQKGLSRAIVKLATKKMPPEEIASTLEVELVFVQQVMKDQGNGS